MKIEFNAQFPSFKLVSTIKIEASLRDSMFNFIKCNKITCGCSEKELNGRYSNTDLWMVEESQNSHFLGVCIGKKIQLDQTYHVIMTHFRGCAVDTAHCFIRCG